MSAPTRRAFLGLAQNAIAVAAVGVVGARLIAPARAMPIAPDPGRRENRPTLRPSAMGPAAWTGLGARAGVGRHAAATAAGFAVASRVVSLRWRWF
jgi:hypothetical protein